MIDRRLQFAGKLRALRATGPTKGRGQPLEFVQRRLGIQHDHHLRDSSGLTVSPLTRQSIA
jgi:hypothetical protein